MDFNEQTVDVCQTCLELNNPRYEGFHAQDGLFFNPLTDGSITVYKIRKNEYGNNETLFAQDLDANTWASVVQFVSKNKLKQVKEQDLSIKATVMKNSEETYIEVTIKDYQGDKKTVKIFPITNTFSKNDFQIGIDTLLREQAENDLRPQENG